MFSTYCYTIRASKLRPVETIGGLNFKTSATTMKTLIKLEELAQFALGIFLFSQLPYQWWLFPALLFAPDIGMLSYVFSNKLGAFTYNLFHHKGIGIAFIILGMLYFGNVFTLIGVILFSHSAMDRIIGYGLKYSDSFHHTHLGMIGNEETKKAGV